MHATSELGPLLFSIYCTCWPLVILLESMELVFTVLPMILSYTFHHNQKKSLNYPIYITYVESPTLNLD